MHSLAGSIMNKANTNHMGCLDVNLGISGVGILFCYKITQSIECADLTVVNANFFHGFERVFDFRLWKKLCLSPRRPDV